MSLLLHIVQFIFQYNKYAPESFFFFLVLVVDTMGDLILRNT